MGWAAKPDAVSASAYGEGTKILPALVNSETDYEHAIFRGGEQLRITTPVSRVAPGSIRTAGHELEAAPPLAALGDDGIEQQRPLPGSRRQGTTRAWVKDPLQARDSDSA